MEMLESDGLFICLTILKNGNGRGCKMLIWQENFLTGESVKNPEKIKKKLNDGKLVPGIYLLTLSENQSNLMDIIPAAMLIQKSFYGICPKIIGMAKGKDEALEMVRGLIDEMYTETGTFGTAEYIENR